MNTTGDSSGINEWLLPYMQLKGIHSIALHYLDDDMKHCEIWPDNISQLATLDASAIFIEANALADIEACPDRVDHALLFVYVDCNPLRTESFMQAVLRKYKGNNKVYFLFNPARNATKVEPTQPNLATSYFV